MVLQDGLQYRPGEVDIFQELNHLEFEFIKSHCQVGFDLLKNIDFPWPVLQAILQHHERLDGSGYPAGLTDKGIILEARILGVADVVKPMHFYQVLWAGPKESTRPWKKFIKRRAFFMTRKW